MLCSTAHFFQPHSGFMAPHQSRSLEGGFCSLSSNFFQLSHLFSLPTEVRFQRSDFFTSMMMAAVEPPHCNFYHRQQKERVQSVTQRSHTHTPTCTPSQATEHIGLMYVLLLHFVAQMARFVRSPKLQIWSLPPWNIFDILNWHRWIKHPRLQGWSFYKVLGILNWCSLIKHPGLQGWNFYNVFGILNWHRWIRFLRHFCCFFVPWATLWS